MLRPISLLRLSLLRLLDSNFPGNYVWTWEFHPLRLRLRLCSSQTSEVQNLSSQIGRTVTASTDSMHAPLRAEGREALCLVAPAIYNLMYLLLIIMRRRRIILIQIIQIIIQLQIQAHTYLVASLRSDAHLCAHASAAHWMLIATCLKARRNPRYGGEP